MLRTNLCIVGFPKCGTTALARFLADSPAMNFTRRKENFETPIFMPEQSASGAVYESGKVNGHKFSAYAYNPVAMRNLILDNADCLTIFTVRSSASALMSWRDMHRRLALTSTGTHYVNKTETRKKFFSECSLDEYYQAYAYDRLRYAAYIAQYMNMNPRHNVLVVGQRRTSEDAAGVVNRIHDMVGVTPPVTYLAGLPTGHKPKGDRDLSKASLSPFVIEALLANDQALIDFLATLPQDRVMLAADGRL